MSRSHGVRYWEHMRQREQARDAAAERDGTIAREQEIFAQVRRERDKRYPKPWAPEILDEMEEWRYRRIAELRGEQPGGSR